MKKFFLIFSILILYNYPLSSQLLFQLGNQGQTAGISVITDKDSNIIVTGTFQGTINCNPKGNKVEISSIVGSIDIFFAKYQRTGELLWAKNIGTTGIDNVTDIEVDKSGNIYLTGYFGSENVPGRFIDLDPSSKEDIKYGPGGIDCFVIKVKPNGDYLWGFVLGNINGNTTEVIWDIELSSSGQLFTTGIFAGTVDFNPKGTRERVTCPKEGYGYFTAKYDKDGKNLWINSLGANIIEPLEEGFTSISIDGNDGCAIVGNFRDTALFEPDTDTDFPMVSTGETDMFIAKYSSSGNITYRGGFGGALKDKVFPGTAKIGADGYLYITGNFLGNCDFYTGSGKYELINNDDSPDMFLASYLLSGTMRWAIKLDGDALEDIPKGINFDEDINIVLNGSFSGNTNFDPDGKFELTSNATNKATDAFIAKYDNFGHLIWAKQFGDQLSGIDKNGILQTTSINDVAMDYDYNLISIGKFFGNVNFADELNPSNLTANNICDMFLVKFDFNGDLWFKGGGRPVLRVISPNGGEIWNVDSTRIITWFSRNVDFVKLEYSVNNGESWFLLIDSLSAESSSFTWVVENNPSELCKVKITNLNDENLTDISNGNFTISNDIKASRVVFSLSNPGSVSGNAICSDNQNNFIVTGTFDGTINIDRGNGLRNLSAKGSKDMFIAKYSEYGDLIWGFNIGESGLICNPNCIGIDGNDNVYVAGYFGKSSQSNLLMDFSNDSKVDTLRTKSGFDAFLAKYDKNGKYLWAIPIANKTGQTKEIINDISIEKNGTIFITGVFNGEVDFDGSKNEKNVSTKSAEPEVFIAKYNSDAVYGWAIGLITNMKDVDSEGKCSIIADGLGGCYLSGNFRDSLNFNPSGSTKYFLKSSGESDIFLAHYKLTSNLDWALNIQGNGLDFTISKSLIMLPSGSLIFAGNFNGKADFDPTLMKREFTSTNGNSDLFLASYDKTGHFKWMQQFPSTSGDDIPRALTLDTNSNLILSGYITDDINIAYLDTTRTIQSHGNLGASDIFLFKFNYEGKNLWSKHIGADTSGNGLLSQANDVIIDKKNNPIITGLFFGRNVDFDSDSTIFELSSEGKENAFIAKYFEDGRLWVEDVDTSSVNLFRPNGNEVFQANTKELIGWTSKGLDSVAIEYSLDDGKTWNWITKSTPAKTGNYLWEVPDTTSEICKVHIFDPNKTKRTDISSRNFIISDKNLKLIRPNGGETFFGGLEETITWESKNVGLINIEYSIDGGNSWTPMVLSIQAENQSFTWKTKNISSNNCLIKIYDRNDNRLFDISDKPFTINKSQKPEIKIISPNGGDYLYTEKSIEIHFVSIKVDSVIIKLVDLSDKRVITINENLTIVQDSTKYYWVFEEESFYSDSCKIVITSLNDSSLYDYSDSVFTISSDLAINDYNQSDCLKDFSINPNPVNEFADISYEIDHFGELLFEFYNTKGEKISSISPENIASGVNTFRINLIDFPTGVVIIRVSLLGDTNKCIKYYKFIKQ